MISILSLLHTDSILSLLHRVQVDLPNVLTTEIGLPCHRISHFMSWCCCSSGLDVGKLSSIGVGVESFLHQFLGILKVTSHSHLELFLPVSDVDFVRHLASDLVDDDRNSAYASVLTLARPPASYSSSLCSCIPSP
jgi:hypothetical protein